MVAYPPVFLRQASALVTEVLNSFSFACLPRMAKSPFSHYKQLQHLWESVDYGQRTRFGHPIDAETGQLAPWPPDLSREAIILEAILKDDISHASIPSRLGHGEQNPIFHCHHGIEPRKSRWGSAKAGALKAAVARVEKKTVQFHKRHWPAPGPSSPCYPALSSSTNSSLSSCCSTVPLVHE